MKRTARLTRRRRQAKFGKGPSGTCPGANRHERRSLSDVEIRKLIAMGHGRGGNFAGFIVARPVAPISKDHRIARVRNLLAHAEALGCNASAAVYRAELAQHTLNHSAEKLGAG